MTDHIEEKADLTEEVTKPCSSIDLIIYPRERDIGGFSVRRLLPYIKCRSIGPWIFFDHMGPATFPAGKGVDVRPHPHINLATVTYLFAGEILHRDSLGSLQPIKPGDINLMVAGKGITHSEREREEWRAQEHFLHGLQLWHALPDDQEEIEPAFYHYSAEQIPTTVINDVPVRVMMGRAYGITSPVKTFFRTTYAEASLKKGQSLTLPSDTEQVGVYVAKGRVSVDGASVNTYGMAVFSKIESVEIHASEESQIAIIGGEKIPPRYMFWNFASSRLERIEQAKDDWKNGKFPKVVGDEKEFIPLPETLLARK